MIELPTPSADANFDLTVRCAREVACSLGESSAQSIQRDLAAALGRACAFVARPISRIHVEIVDEQEMARLHEQFSNVSGVTDVLTFPSSAPLEPIDVDVVICHGVGARVALERGHPIERELLLYALHGVLHCAGFDDRDTEAHSRIHAEEDRILDAIGIGRTFANRAEGETA